MSVLVGQPTLIHAESAVAARSRLAGFLRAGSVFLLAAAPLAFGATSTLAVLILISASWFLLVVWLAGEIGRGRVVFPGHSLVLPVLLLVALTAVHWAARISATPLATRFEWLRWVANISFAAVAVAAFDSPRRLRRLAVLLAVCGLLIAVLGIAQSHTSGGKIYWLFFPPDGSWGYGPYMNRNHFAGLMELWMPLALGLALMPQNHWSRRLLWCGVAFVMGLAVILSGSRGGGLAVTVELLLFIAAGIVLLRGQRALLVLLVAFVLIGGLVVALDRSELLERYKVLLQAPANEADGPAAHRIEAWQGTLEIFRRHWIIGSGLDTFSVHFPGVRSFWTDKVWTHAHNDILQFVAETGLVGSLLGAWLLLAGGREIFLNLADTQGRATGAVLLGMACGCCGFLVHAWLDFNFHVPANAANFSVLAAVLTRRGWCDV